MPTEFFIASQDFEPAYSGFDCEAADDFVVPSGAWTVQSVFLHGTYDGNPGPVVGFHVTFYSDAGQAPGTEVCNFQSLPYVFDGLTGFTIDLGTGCALDPGSYWISVVARMDIVGSGQWYWVFSDTGTEDHSQWRNPNGAFGSGCDDWCPTWMIIGPDPPPPDLTFQLWGIGSAAIFTDGFESGDTTLWSATVP